MSDLRSIMIEAVGSTPSPAPLAVADADLARGRQARRRHRVARLGAGSGLILTVAAVGAFAIASSTGGNATSPQAAPASSSVAPGIKLVAYQGTQPVGYTLDKVPDGWVVAHNDTGALTLAPKGAKDDSSTDGSVSFENKIAIGLEGAVPSGIQKDKVEVDGKSAVIAHMLGSGGKPDGTLTLFLEQGSARYLTIQVWNGSGWDNNRIAEFAAGVHVTKDAQLGVG